MERPWPITLCFGYDPKSNGCKPLPCLGVFDTSKCKFATISIEESTLSTDSWRKLYNVYLFLQLGCVFFHHLDQSKPSIISLARVMRFSERHRRQILPLMLDFLSLLFSICSCFFLITFKKFLYRNPISVIVTKVRKVSELGEV